MRRVRVLRSEYILILKNFNFKLILIYLDSSFVLIWVVVKSYLKSWNNKINRDIRMSKASFYGDLLKDHDGTWFSHSHAFCLDRFKKHFYTNQPAILRVKSSPASGVVRIPWFFLFLFFIRTLTMSSDSKRT